MTLTRLASNGGGGLIATVTFTSHQSPAQSVDHSACNAWTLNLYLVPQGTGYLIGPAPSGYQPHLLRLLASVHGRTACRALGRGGVGILLVLTGWQSRDRHADRAPARRLLADPAGRPPGARRLPWR